MSEETNFDAVFGMDNPEPNEAPVEQAAPEPVAQSEQQPEQAVDASQIPGHVYKSMREDLERKSQLEAQRAYEEGLRAAQQQAQQPVHVPEPPDMFEDPEGYRTYLRDSLKSELMQELAPSIQQTQAQMAQLTYEKSLANARAEAAKNGHDFDKLLDLAGQFALKYPSIVGDIQRSADPGKEILALGLSINGQPIDRDSLKQEILAEVAQDRAKKGVIPEAPRGVGAATPSNGLNDSMPPPSEWHRLNRNQVDKIKDQLFSQ